MLWNYLASWVNEGYTFQESGKKKCSEILNCTKLVYVAVYGTILYAALF